MYVQVSLDKSDGLVAKNLSDLSKSDLDKNRKNKRSHSQNRSAVTALTLTPVIWRTHTIPGSLGQFHLTLDAMECNVKSCSELISLRLGDTVLVASFHTFLRSGLREDLQNLHSICHEPVI